MVILGAAMREMNNVIIYEQAVIVAVDAGEEMNKTNQHGSK
jgi:hypothetical protein